MVAKFLSPQINAASGSICTPSPLGAPRNDDSVVQMLGWSGMMERLQVTQVFMTAGTTCPFKDEGVMCATAPPNSSIGECGGNLGSPVFFSSHFVAAIVVDDQFCGSDAPKGAFLSVLPYHAWITENVASGALRTAGRTMLILTIVSLRTKWRVD